MSKPIIVIPAGLVGVNDLKDRSCKMTFETRELDNQEFLALRDVRGQEGWLGFALNLIQETDFPKEQAEKGVKTPSQRLRAVIYRLWEQEKSKLDFEVFYQAKMESIIQHLKNKLQ